MPAGVMSWPEASESRLHLMKGKEEEEVTWLNRWLLNMVVNQNSPGYLHLSEARVILKQEVERWYLIWGEDNGHTGRETVSGITAGFAEGHTHLRIVPQERSEAEYPWASCPHLP